MDSRMDKKIEASLIKKSDGLSLSIRPFNDVSDEFRNNVYSPVTDLAHNFSAHLTTRIADFNETPKRRLCLTGVEDTPTPVRPSAFKVAIRPPSVDQGCFVDSPSPLEDSPSEILFKTFSTENDENESNAKNSFRVKKSAFRRFSSMPNASLSSSYPPAEPTSNLKVSFCVGEPEPSFSQDSQDSGLGKDDEYKDDLKDDFQFVAPTRRPPRTLSRLLIDDEMSCSPLKYSPVKPSRPCSAPAGTLGFSEGSPVSLSTSSLTSSMNDDDEADDGFLDTHFLDSDDLKHSSSIPSGLSDLITAPMISPENQENHSPKKHIRGLFRSPSVPDFTLRRPSLTYRKRTDRPKDYHSPVQNKRRKSTMVNENNSTGTLAEVLKEINTSKSKHKLQRCHSAVESTIKHALHKASTECDLIGDCSLPYCLPLTKGKHQDLKSIIPETLQALLNNEYSHVIEKYLIIDCRYPYEYNGGHIQSAKNIYTKEAIMKEFLENPSKHMPSESGKRSILIFHCEFSSERAPKLSRFLRNKDRDANKDSYPQLHYPELYLLDGGYKNFFGTKKASCEPQSYKTMLDEDHSEDLKHFRKKSKSWAGDSKTQSRFRTGLNF